MAAVGNYIFHHQQISLQSALWWYLIFETERGFGLYLHQVLVYKMLCVRKVFWQCCLLKLHRHTLFFCFLMAMNMPGFLSVSSKTKGKVEPPSNSLSMSMSLKIRDRWHQLLFLSLLIQLVHYRRPPHYSSTAIRINSVNYVKHFAELR